MKLNLSAIPAALTKSSEGELQQDISDERLVWPTSDNVSGHRMRDVSPASQLLSLGLRGAAVYCLGTTFVFGMSSAC